MCIYVCKDTCTYLLIYIYTYIYVCVDMHMYKTYICVYMHDMYKCTWKLRRNLVTANAASLIMPDKSVGLLQYGYNICEFHLLLDLNLNVCGLNRKGREIIITVIIIIISLICLKVVLYELDLWLDITVSVVLFQCSHYYMYCF